MVGKKFYNPRSGDVRTVSKMETVGAKTIVILDDGARFELSVFQSMYKNVTDKPAKEGTPS